MSDLVQGILDTLVLNTLVRGRAHGHAIPKSLRRKSDTVLRIEESASSPTLHQAELHGRAASDCGISEKNRRVKSYRMAAIARVVQAG